jgi:CheY-like chemotaxis protein
MAVPSAEFFHILIIDDDQEDAVLLTEFLKQAGRFKSIPKIVTSYREGMSCLKDGTKYDVVLLDYKLPDGDGLEFLAEARRLHFRFPFVIVTNYNANNLGVQALEAGAVDYLEKGKITPDTLERTCLYAISLNEKRLQNGGGPGVGPLIETLVDLTRESVSAQTKTSEELRHFQTAMAKSFENLNTCITHHNADCEQRSQRLTEEVKGITKFRWLLDWIAKHPGVTILIVILLLIAAVTGVALLASVDTDKVREIRDATESVQLITTHLQGRG